MAKRGGFPGGGMPGNMANLMKQAQKMQRQMEESQKELEEKEITAAAGGGAVEVTVSGNFTVRKLSVYANQSLIEVSEVAEKSMLFIFLQLLKALSLIVLKPAGKVNEANEKFSAKA